MTSRHDGRLGLVVDAASFPARAAAGVCRDRLEDVAEAVLAAPGTRRAVDRALAGPLPEEIVRSAVRNRVLERMLAELAAEGALDDLLNGALRSTETSRILDRIVASDAMQRALRDVMASPEVRHALAGQTVGFSEEVVSGLRDRAAGADERADRRGGDRPAAYAGIVSRALAFAVDAVVCAALFVSVAGVAALAGWMVGGLRPAWLVGALMTAGLAVLGGCYFAFFWSTAGRTPGMHLLHLRVTVADGSGAPSPRRSLLRLAGLAIAIIPFFAGFLPVLFERRRRGIPDMLAGTVVVYGASSREAAATGSPPPPSPSAR